MKCTLLIPSWVPEDIFSSKTAASQINYWQPLGTLSVAAVLQKAGHDVIFLNGAFLRQEELLQKVEQFSPAFIGIYSTTFGWDKAKRTALELRRILGKSVFICSGGPYPIAAQEKSLEDAGESMDAVVTGEGEFTVLETVERLTAGKSLEGIQGLVWRNNGKITKNPPRPLIEDLDSLPFPARELLGDPNLYIPTPATYRRKPVTVMMTSRGCNRQCIYCFQLDKDRKTGIRYRSIENVLKEIEHVLAQGYREIKFLDDTLAADYNRAMRFAQEIKTRKLDFTWFVSACVNQVDKPLLQAFKDAGCWAILFGAESGVQKNLNTIRKGTTLDQIRAAVKAAKEVGLTVQTPFIFGIPGETYEEGLQTIEFAVEIDPDIASFHAITPFPGTYLYDNLDRYGTMSEDLTDFTYQGAAFIPRTMTREQILDLRQKAFRRFYSRPSYILRRIASLRSWDDITAVIKAGRSLFWLWFAKDLFKKKKTGGTASSQAR
jgi:anaerobic magnesium-protoporphyrin IX monomethyl ester cyclase